MTPANPPPKIPHRHFHVGHRLLEDLRSIFLIDSLKDFVEWAPFWPSLPCGESAEGVARFTFYKFEVWPATHGIQAMTDVS